MRQEAFAMLEYPKIETLFVRDEVTHRIPMYVPERALRRVEFSVPSRWLLTEKIDGTNIRIPFSTKAAASPSGDSSYVGVRGRTDAAQIPPFLLSFLQETFTLEKLLASFDPDTIGILFGEGYGPRIQKGGGNYRSDVSFRLFDVVVFGADDHAAWWLDWNDIEDVARKLGIETVPVVGRGVGLGEAIQTVEAGLGSAVAYQENGRTDVNAEGVVARTDPLLFDRRGHRLVWKLKERDFS
jgi:hypothetical protein